MEPVLTETTADCAICGEIGCERDLLYVTDEDVADELSVAIGDIVCRDCGKVA